MTLWRCAVCTLTSALLMFAAAPASVLAQDAQDAAAHATTTQSPAAGQISGPVENAIDSGVDDIPELGTAQRIPVDRVQPDDAEEAEIRPSAVEPTEDFDRWERFNDKTFEFNRRLDKHALKPVAKVWKSVVPEQGQIMISNAFDNLNVVPRVVNNLLQGKWEGAGREASRFLINSTVGVGGVFDPAKDVWKITKSPADFGQTLGKWGNGPGPYLVLPFMEPLTVRDGIGRLVDHAMDPLSYVVPLVPALILRTGKNINERALNYELFSEFEAGVIDPYAAVRDGYLQRRQRMLSE